MKFSKYASRLQITLLSNDCNLWYCIDFYQLDVNWEWFALKLIIVIYTSKCQYLQLFYAKLEFDTMRENMHRSKKKQHTNIKFSYNVVFMKICVECLDYYNDIFFIWIFSAMAHITEPCEFSIIYYCDYFLLCLHRNFPS